MNDQTMLRTGIIGSVIAAICCFTPLLVWLVSAVGLAAVVAYLDVAGEVEVQRHVEERDLRVRHRRAVVRGDHRQALVRTIAGQVNRLDVEAAVAGGHAQGVEQRVKVDSELRARLGTSYDILWEHMGTVNAHLHIEYDPKP